ncbi:MAG TPA: hypothetical protein VFE15_08650 [Marmoricola sp.]|nr:hypothetical protein [Marmoricola sp.]
MRDEEVARRFPCDDLVDGHVLAAYRGVSVAAAADRVWPWLVQVRLAPYSYDWIDNLGRRSPQRLRDLADPVPGDRFSCAGGRPVGRVLSVTPGEQLTATIMGARMSYVLVPEGPTTRLLLKVVMPRGRLLAPFVSIGDLVMARRQLLNLKSLAER